MSNSRNVHSALRSTASSAGRWMPGHVTCTNCCHALAPSTRAASYSDVGIDCSAASSVIVKNGKLFQTVGTITAAMAVRASTNQAMSVLARPRSRRTALNTPYDASSIHRNVMLTTTPGHGPGQQQQAAQPSSRRERAVEQQREQQSGNERRHERCPPCRRPSGRTRPTATAGPARVRSCRARADAT